MTCFDGKRHIARNLLHLLLRRIFAYIQFRRKHAKLRRRLGFFDIQFAWPELIYFRYVKFRLIVGQVVYLERQHLYVAIPIKLFADIIPRLNDDIEFAVFAGLKHQIRTVYGIYFEMAVRVFYKRRIDIVRVIEKQRQMPVYILAIVYLDIQNIGNAAVFYSRRNVNVLNCRT